LERFFFILSVLSALLSLLCAIKEGRVWGILGIVSASVSIICVIFPALYENINTILWAFEEAKKRVFEFSRQGAAQMIVMAEEPLGRYETVFVFLVFVPFLLAAVVLAVLVARLANEL
jgi:hypothetical protein